MKITADLLRAHNEYMDRVSAFAALWPDGLEPTVEAVFIAEAAGFDVLGWTRLLPREGPGSRRAFTLWCVEQMAHHSDDPRVLECLQLLRRRVFEPSAVSAADLVAMWNGWVAARAVWAGAGTAARPAERAAAREAGIAMLAVMLQEAT